MTGRKKHAERSRKTHRTKYIPVEMFRANGFQNEIKKDERTGNKDGLLARLARLFARKKARESHDRPECEG